LAVDKGLDALAQLASAQDTVVKGYAAAIYAALSQIGAPVLVFTPVAGLQC
jgi:hypothetical protein